MSDVDIEAPHVQQTDYRIKMRARLIWSAVAIGAVFGLCFYFSEVVLSLLLFPYEHTRGDGEELQLIYTAPEAYFFTSLKLALFGATFFAFPLIASHIYRFAAPQFCVRQRKVYFVTSFWALVSFLLGAAFVYGMDFRYLLTLIVENAGAGQTPSGPLLMTTNELGSIMQRICVYGLLFQLPVLLLVLRREGQLSRLVDDEKYSSDIMTNADKAGLNLNFKVNRVGFSEGNVRSQTPSTGGKDTA